MSLWKREYANTAKGPTQTRRSLRVERFEERKLLAADFEPVKVINPATTGSFPSSFRQLGNDLIFRASTELGGELWKSDGSVEGTRLLKDIAQGAANGYVDNLTLVGSTIFFTASNAIDGNELWKSDGTEQGTVLVRDIRPGPGGSSPFRLLNVAGTLYFFANDGSSGYELWKSDGTSGGTVQVRDIVPGSGSLVVTSSASLNGLLVFSGSDGSVGAELWRSDGTSAGTFLLLDIQPGSGSSNPGTFAQVGNFLYFSANDGTNGAELWRTGGTPASTSLVRNINPGSSGSYPFSLTNLSGVLCFQATSSSGAELWRSDGTAVGTVQIKDIRIGSYSSSPSALTNIAGMLYFSADDGITGRELWRSDGTPIGTTLVQDLNPGSTGSSPSEFMTNNGSIFFTANTNAGLGLWRADGATATLLKHTIPANSSLTGLTSFGGALFFAGSESPVNVELWKSDGTSFGTQLFKDLNSTLFGSSTVFLSQVNDKVFFTASTPDVGQALWVSDGSEAGTYLVKDINSTSTNLTVAAKVNVNGVLYFTASDGTSGYELWRSNGTASGTLRVKDIIIGSGSSSPRYLTNVNGTLYFVAADISGFELWRTDGTEPGTVQVKDIFPGFSSSNPAGLLNANGILMFRASDANGTELWRSDGTSVGTTLVKNINAAGSSYPSNLSMARGKLYFSANDGVMGSELWVSDGTAAGTVLLADINPGANNATPSDFTELGGTVFFVATNANGRELWMTDGTPAGTALFKDIRPGANGSSPQSLLNLNNQLYFTAIDESGGRNLWKSDGTVSGTVQVVNMNPPNGSSIYQLTNINGNLVFSANNGLVNRTYVSNGTAAGTTPIISNDTTATQAPVTGHYLAIGSKLYVSSNDFSQVRSSVNIDLTNSTADRSIVLRKMNLGIEVVDQNTSTQLAFISNLAMASVQSLNILGSNAFNESVTIDLQSGGFFTFPQGVTINGGTSPGDALTILGTASQRLQWTTGSSVSSAMFSVLQQNSHADGAVSGFENITSSGLLSISANNLLQAGPPNLFLNSLTTFLLAPTTILGGGTLSTTAVAALATGSVLSGAGTMSGRFSGDIGSVVLTTGNMSIGSSTSSSGFLTRGDMVVNQHSVSLLDANEAVLGSQTTLGSATAPGSVTATNGLLVDFGNNVSGYGSLNTPNLASKSFTLNGSVNGDSDSHPITLTGYIRGVGTLNNVSIAGTYSPGFSPAAVNVGSVDYASMSTTVIEIGGNAPGSEHDQINHLGSATLGGTLSVQLINSVVPNIGSSYTIMTASAGFSGSFAAVNLPTAPLGAGWSLTTNSNNMVLQLVNLAEVSAVQFGDGSVQRSRVDKLIVTFDGAVDIDLGAFELLKRGPTGGPVATSFLTSQSPNGDTIASISFSGVFTRAAGALLDGYYQLTIDHAKVRRAGTQLTLDGDRDGLAGGNFSRGSAAIDSFFAYFGDSSGDGQVGIAEFGQFRSSFGKLLTDPGYNPLFDYDGSGVGVADFGAFRTRFGKSIPFE